MWFDAHARLAEIQGRQPATPATSATNTTQRPPNVAEVAGVATQAGCDPNDELIRNLERCAEHITDLADPDGVARSTEAIEAVWDHAEVLARVQRVARVSMRRIGRQDG